MAIEKNSFKSSRFDSEFSPRSRDTMSSEEEDLQRRTSGVVDSDEDDDDNFDDCDSGAGSDDFDLLELGEAGEEFCQLGDQTCSIPYGLYDLAGLGDVLSLDVWNEVLTEEERFSLTQYLPDMDHENFMRTLKEILTGCNMHFGSPLDKLFAMLKAGLCDPRAYLYQQGRSFLLRREHYHLLRKHQNSMVTNLYQIRDAWLNCKGYSIEEKLRVLNIVKSQKSLMSEKMEEMESEASDREESGDGLWGKRTRDRRTGQKMSRYSGYAANSGLDFPSHGRQTALEPAKLDRKNMKGALKLSGTKISAGKESLGDLLPVRPDKEIKSGSFASTVHLSRNNRAAAYNSRAVSRMRDHMIADEEEDEMYEVAVRRDKNFERAGEISRPDRIKKGKKRDALKNEEHADTLMDLSTSVRSYGRNKAVNQLSDIKVLTAKPFNARTSQDYVSKANFAENGQQFGMEGQMKYGKNQFSIRGNQMELQDGTESSWTARTRRDPFSVDPSHGFDDWNSKNKKWKMGQDSLDVKVNNTLFYSEHRPKALHERMKPSNTQNGGRCKGVKTSGRGEETESDSSEQIDDEDDDNNPLMRSKWAFPTGFPKAKSAKKDRKDHVQIIDGQSYHSAKSSDFGDHLHRVSAGNFRLEQKSKTHDYSWLDASSAKVKEGRYLAGPGRSNHDDGLQDMYKSGRNSHMFGGAVEKVQMASFMERRHRGGTSRDNSAPQSNIFQEYDPTEEEKLFHLRASGKDNVAAARLGKKGQHIETIFADSLGISDVQLVGCNSTTKRRKVKDEGAYTEEQDDGNIPVSHTRLQLDDSNLLKKWGKKKLEDNADAPEKGLCDLSAPEIAEEDMELETRPQKKPFTLITPTVHSGFSFSIIHLLSAVRVAMITQLPEDTLDIGKNCDKSDAMCNDREDPGKKQEDVDFDVNGSATNQASVPSLAVQEIVSRVRSNPGDPCILETQEPLQDLVRGVLKIFSSRTAPLGAKGWKPLVLYEKATKTWLWIGPVHHSPSDNDALEEVTSPEAWGLPHKMLVKLVDSFANWLKNGQETLQQIGSLPAPPLSLMEYNLDEKDRFRDLRAQKSLSTIGPSSQEVRAYFRKEEVLRYSIPDRAFSYTAIDGRKSIVAPLRRCGGKPTSKARDHFMLKRDRPPHVTILCLVRDAAARLPGSIGTRADVCTLIRDSQYIVEDVSDAQVNQVVSGALDRLHYERDPCVQFDGERKLWVYLHREREEEDFEDDGTSSTKKWKRQKKDTTETFDHGTVTVAYHGPSDQTGFDLSSDLNVEPSCTDEDKKPDLPYDDGGDPVEENVETSHEPEQDAVHGDETEVAWETFAYNATPENKMLCQENSANDEFDDETFEGEPPL